MRAVSLLERLLGIGSRNIICQEETPTRVIKQLEAARWHKRGCAQMVGEMTRLLRDEAAQEPSDAKDPV